MMKFSFIFFFVTVLFSFPALAFDDTYNKSAAAKIQELNEKHGLSCPFDHQTLYTEMVRMHDAGLQLTANDPYHNPQTTIAGINILSDNIKNIMETTVVCGKRLADYTDDAFYGLTQIKSIGSINVYMNKLDNGPWQKLNVETAKFEKNDLPKNIERAMTALPEYKQQQALSAMEKLGLTCPKTCSVLDTDYTQAVSIYHRLLDLQPSYTVGDLRDPKNQEEFVQKKAAFMADAPRLSLCGKKISDFSSEEIDLLKLLMKACDLSTPSFKMFGTSDYNSFVTMYDRNLKNFASYEEEIQKQKEEMIKQSEAASRKNLIIAEKIRTSAALRKMRREDSSIEKMEFEFCGEHGINTFVLALEDANPEGKFSFDSSKHYFQIKVKPKYDDPFDFVFRKNGNKLVPDSFQTGKKARRSDAGGLFIMIGTVCSVY